MLATEVFSQRLLAGGALLGAVAGVDEVAERAPDDGVTCYESLKVGVREALPVVSG